MTDDAAIDERLHEELSAIAEGAGCELAHVEFKGSLLRLVLDRTDGAVSVDDCALVSRQVSALLDVVDFGPGRYTLEVSSPGLDRPLWRPADYSRFTGRLARVTFTTAEGAKKTVVGRLAGYDEHADGGAKVTLQVGEELLELPLARIVRARLEIEL
jgi:ribosome maturation factor RimP